MAQYQQDIVKQTIITTTKRLCDHTITFLLSWEIGYSLTDMSPHYDDTCGRTVSKAEWSMISSTALEQPLLHEEQRNLNIRGVGR